MIENAEFVMNCRYVRAGCLVEGLTKDLDDHEIACVHRPVPCPQLTCAADKMSLKFLENHLKEQHRFRHVRKRDDGWNVDRLGFQLIVLQDLQNKSTGADFLRTYQYDDGSGRVFTNFHVKNGTFYIWLTLECSPSQAKNCLGTIRLSNPVTKYYNVLQKSITSIMIFWIVSMSIVLSRRSFYIPHFSSGASTKGIDFMLKND
jgi:hypothetical protein